MKLFSTIIFLTLLFSLKAQTIWNPNSTNSRLYKEITSYDRIQDSEGFADEFLTLWNKADSFFKDMPLKIAVNYYNDSVYSIRYYSFLKILGQNDSLAFQMLPRYISDSTKVFYHISDIILEIRFNELLARAYEDFIDSKYYWCDTLQIHPMKYFRLSPFQFSKINYPKWPSILTNFINLVKPWNIQYYHNPKSYLGPEYFIGR